MIDYSTMGLPSQAPTSQTDTVHERVAVLETNVRRLEERVALLENAISMKSAESTLNAETLAVIKRHVTKYGDEAWPSDKKEDPSNPSPQSGNS